MGLCPSPGHNHLLTLREEGEGGEAKGLNGGVGICHVSCDKIDILYFEHMQRYRQSW